MTDAIHSDPNYTLTVDHPLISCDDHLDLNQLPGDLWSSRLPEHLRAKGPRIEEHDGRLEWVCNGKRWGSWHGGDKGSTAPKPVYTAFDRGGVRDLTERRAANPVLRLQDMDRDGVYSHVIFGPVTSINTEETMSCETLATRSIMTGWPNIARTIRIGCSAYRCCPNSPEAATAELYRIAKRGLFKQANLQIAVAKPRLHDERWEPFWNALEGNRHHSLLPCRRNHARGG